MTSTTMTTPATSTRPRWKAEGEGDRTSSRGGSAGHGPSFYFEARLVLDNVLPMQSGNYTCGPSNTQHASVRLHITKGQRKPNQSNGYQRGQIGKRTNDFSEGQSMSPEENSAQWENTTLKCLIIGWLY